MIRNDKDILTFEKLGLDPPEEEHCEIDVTFFEISFIEPKLNIDLDEKVIGRTYIHSNNESMITSLTVDQVLAECVKCGWYD